MTRSLPTGAAAAPLTTEWNVVLTTTDISQIGLATGHPVLGSRRVVTPQLWAIDPDLRSGRTLSRFYRLDEPAFAAPPSLH